MGLFTSHQEVRLGVGDLVRVVQKMTEKGKSRVQNFDGIIIAIKGENKAKSITVRNSGSLGVGFEKVIPLDSPTLAEIKVKKSGTKGVRRSKLYYLRSKSRKDIEKIYKSQRLK